MNPRNEKIIVFCAILGTIFAGLTYLSTIVSEEIGIPDWMLISIGPKDPLESVNTLLRERGLNNVADLQAAVKMINVLLNENADDLDARLSLAHIYFQEEEYLQALVQYEKIIEEEPNNISALNNLGVTYIILQGYERALSTLEHGLEIEPDNQVLLNNKGIALTFLNKLHESKSILNKVIELNPSFTAAYNNLAVVHLYSKDIDNALKVFEYALEINPDNSFLIDNFQLAKANKEKFKDGIVPSDKIGLLAGSIPSGENDLDMKSLKNVESEGSIDDPNFVLKKSDQYQEKGIFTVSEFLYQIVKDMYEEKNLGSQIGLRVITGMGNSLTGLEQYEEALAEYEDALKLNPNYINAKIGKANVLVELRKFAEAENLYGDVLLREHENVNALNGLGVLSMKLGKFSEAIEIFEIVLQIDENKNPKNINVNALKGLAETHFIIGEYHKSLEFYKRAEQEQPNDPEIVTGIFLNYFHIGDTKQYEIYKIKSVESNRQIAIDIWMLAQQFETLEETERAKKLYEYAKKIYPEIEEEMSILPRQ